MFFISSILLQILQYEFKIFIGIFMYIIFHMAFITQDVIFHRAFKII